MIVSRSFTTSDNSRFSHSGHTSIQVYNHPEHTIKSISLTATPAADNQLQEVKGILRPMRKGPFFKDLHALGTFDLVIYGTTEYGHPVHSYIRGVEVEEIPKSDDMMFRAVLMTGFGQH